MENIREEYKNIISMLIVGEILKKEREDKNIQLKDVEKTIKVREKFLKAVEENNWDFFPSKIYITGIIKNYATFLGLDPKKTLAFFRRDYEKKEETRFKTRISVASLTPETRKIITLGLAVLFLFVFLYFGFQLKNYFSPPSVTLLAPKTDRFTTDDKIKIVGKTEKDTMVAIFGERIYQNKEGIFEYQLPLHPGINELIIELTGANGKKTTLRKNFYKSLK